MLAATKVKINGSKKGEQEHIQPRSQGSLLGRVGENPGNEVGTHTTFPP